jgi:hypothetical protein
VSNIDRGPIWLFIAVIAVLVFIITMLIRAMMESKQAKGNLQEVVTIKQIDDKGDNHS